jgi:hypothetical protein
LVEVGKLAEHRQAQASEVIDVRRDSGAVQQAYFHGGGRFVDVDDALG